MPPFFLLLALGAATPPSGLQLEPTQFRLADRYSTRQLLATLHGSDATRTVAYSVEPAHLVSIDSTGHVRARGKGRATITARVGKHVATSTVVVDEASDERRLDFARDILPLLTRHGCNAGGCHGKASGQNGFKLSLFGFDAAFDYRAIVSEGRGRRLFPAAPETSLLLTKGAGQVAHGGGKRIVPGTEPYEVLLRWIVQGAPGSDPSAPALKRLEVVPAQRVLARASRQQLAVLAHYADGTTRDITRQAQYQSNEAPIAAVDEDGMVRTFDLAGEAAVMARYQGLVGVFYATVPSGLKIDKEPAFTVVNYVDKHAQAKWRKLGLAPSEPCGDAEFLRRVTLDLCGRLPTTDEAKTFLDDKDARKRAKKIDALLDSPDYAAYWAMRWGSVLRNSQLAGSEAAAYAFHDWLKDMIGRNRPYDQLVRGVVAASGEWQDSPAINWYWQMRDDPLHQPVSDTAQVFLGLRLQCAKCHHHPYERWSQDDYYGLAGFFTRIGRKSFGEPPPYYASRTRTNGEINPRTRKPIEPKYLDGPEPKFTPEDDPRHKLVDWMARPDNPFFAKALVNRMWGHLFSRGLVDPVDDMRETNPPSNAPLLEALASDFVRSKFDLKHLLRTMANSSTYQLSSVPTEFNKHDRQNHARYYAKRLIAEVLLDAVDAACGTRTRFSRMSKSARAVDLPHEGFGSYFLDVFDRPTRSSPCECARSNGASLTAVLHLANSDEVENKLSDEKGRAARLAKEKTEAAKAVEDLYLAALTRRPTAAELAKARAHLAKEADPRKGLEDLLWALLNSREFLFNH